MMILQHITSSIDCEGNEWPSYRPDRLRDPRPTRYVGMECSKCALGDALSVDKLPGPEQASTEADTQTDRQTDRHAGMQAGWCDAVQRPQQWGLQN